MVSGIDEVDVIVGGRTLNQEIGDGKVVEAGAQWVGPTQDRLAVLGTLVRLFGPRAARPDAFYERDWAREEWSRGCYGAYLPPGAWTAFGRALRPPVGPLYRAGSEHAERWSGYMEGAVRSGEAAAATILRS
jgi:monoamine oxidase